MVLQSMRLIDDQGVPCELGEEVGVFEDHLVGREETVPPGLLQQ